MPHRRRQGWRPSLLLPLAALTIAALACQSLGPDSPSATRVVPTEERLPNPEGLATDAFGTPAPTDEAPVEEPTSGGPVGITGSGADYTQPMALGQTLTVANWDVAVNAYHYGDQATEVLGTMSDLVDTPPNGFQYVIVQLTATSRYADNDNHGVPYDVRLLADNRHSYNSAGFPTVKEPFEGEVRKDESVTGWLVFLSPVETKEFQLVFSDFDNDFNTVEGYFALTPNAALPAADPSTFPPDNEVGIDPKAPARIGETVVVGRFALTITEILRGDAADKIIAESVFAPEPEAGQEFALARIRVLAVGREPKLQSFSTILFSVQPSSGDPIGLPFLVLPGESVDTSLIPGGELEAYLPLAIPSDDPGALLYYDPTFGFGDETPARYFSLQP